MMEQNALRVNFESSGNLLNAFSRASKATKTSEGRYTLFNIAYAQYAKFDFDYTKILRFDERNSLALHGGLGIAIPYGIVQYFHLRNVISLVVPTLFAVGA